MRVVLVWPDCCLLNGAWTERKVDSFWVECTSEEANTKVLPLAEGKIVRAFFPRHYDDAGSEKRFFLVAKDMSSVQEMAWYYPYAGQWDAYCPFRELPQEVHIADLKELENVIIPLSLRGRSFPS